MIKPQLLCNDWGFIIINHIINKDVNNRSSEPLFTRITKGYLLIKEVVNITRQIRKPTRYYTVLVSMSFVIGIEKMIEVTLGIPLQGKIKSYPQKKQSLNDQSHRVTRLLHTSGVVWFDI